MSIYVFILGIAALFLVYAWFYTRGDALTGRATVVSRRVEVGRFATRGTYGNGWNYLVTFRFSDGDELELFVSPEEYKALTEGSTGTLVWYNNTLSRLSKIWR